MQLYTIWKDLALGDYPLPGRVQANSGRNGRDGTVKQKHLGTPIVENGDCKVKLFLGHSNRKLMHNTTDDQSTTDKGVTK